MSRSIPNATDKNAVGEFLSSIDALLKSSEGQTELSGETKKDVVRDLVRRVGELRGGLESAKEGGESAGAYHEGSEMCHYMGID